MFFENIIMFLVNIGNHLVGNQCSNIGNQCSNPTSRLGKALFTRVNSFVEALINMVCDLKITSVSEKNCIKISWWSDIPLKRYQRKTVLRGHEIHSSSVIIKTCSIYWYNNLVQLRGKMNPYFRFFKCFRYFLSRLAIGSSFLCRNVVFEKMCHKAIFNKVFGVIIILLNYFVVLNDFFLRKFYKLLCS